MSNKNYFAMNKRAYVAFLDFLVTDVINLPFQFLTCIIHFRNAGKNALCISFSVDFAPKTQKFTEYLGIAQSTWTQHPAYASR